MKKLLFIGVLLLGMGIFAQTITSPNKKLTLEFTLSKKGEASYRLLWRNKEVIKKSKLGLMLKHQPHLTHSFTIKKIETSVGNTTWTPVWGEEKQIQNIYREMRVFLIQKKHKRQLLICFRLFDDGLGFRYEIPTQKHIQYFIITKEITQFHMIGDHKTFWIPGDYDTNEYAYSTTKLSKIDATRGKFFKEIATKTIIAKNAVQTPLMMKSSEGLYINIHEAALVNYPAMHILVNQKNFCLSSHLAPDAVGNKAYMQTPAKTPWRTIIISDKAEDILSSRIILNLNEPSKVKDTRWIKPQKYIGIWWGMHIGKYSWNYADQNNIKLSTTNWSKLKPNKRHGATTENTKRYIDFAAKHGFDGVLVEGWNVGWEDWFGKWKEEVFDFTTPYPDFDIKALQKYAAQKGVKLIMHHETSGSVTNYERRMIPAYKLMKKYGYDTVKTGYVGRIIPRGEYHDGQWMVNHYIRVAQKTAFYKIMLNAHESSRPTGLHRTYPNWLACEAARGNEFNAWSSGNPPEHETILPFTRLIGGPMDYTPGIFKIKLPSGKQVHTTLAKQLALYVTMYSPLQMAADLPENYERFIDAFQFIKDVPVDWDKTKIIAAEPGDFITIARKAKQKDAWYIGAITDEQAREISIPLDFLPKKKWYIATIYRDSNKAHWKNNPMAYKIEHYRVNYKHVLSIRLAHGGGAAIALKPASIKDKKHFSVYKNK